MSQTLRIGLVQANLAWEDPSRNFRHFESLLQEADSVDLLVLPEMWSTGFSMRPEVIAESSPGPALEWMKAHSQKLNTAIAGSIAVADGGKYYNRCYIVQPQGHIDHYDKKHLFSYGKEDRHYTAGIERKVIEIKGWKVMPIVCYDLRFPVWCRNVDAKYDLMIVMANWPAPRIHHWDALLRARAIENQSYIAAVNRIGTDGNGLHYPGHSIVIDMNGEQAVDIEETESVRYVTIDKDTLNDYREHYRFLQDQDPFNI